MTIIITNRNSVKTISIIKIRFAIMIFKPLIINFKVIIGTEMTKNGKSVKTSSFIKS